MRESTEKGAEAILLYVPYPMAGRPRGLAAGAAGESAIQMPVKYQPFRRPRISSKTPPTKASAPAHDPGSISGAAGAATSAMEAPTPNKAKASILLKLLPPYMHTK